MKTKALVVAAAIAACLSSSAFAQSYEYRDRVEYRERAEHQYGDDDANDDRPYRATRAHRYERSDYERADYDRRDRHHGRRHRMEGAGPERDLFVGSRLPQAYWDGRHKVRDWRRARLSTPLPGHNWHRIGNDFVLSSVHTGKISRIIVQ